ncbi:MAG TPA: YhjD/YihY/BrkB family envelope integrity protein [Ktedonobacterales bacterium]|nr:YhjD/YihY/BrkB family envelope integrity protein [Ktedonobacterales bacterium]
MAEETVREKTVPATRQGTTYASIGDAAGETVNEPARVPQPRLGRSARLSRRLGAVVEMAGGFWTKLNNDWIFNLAGLLAYNFLMALFPLLLLLLAGCGLVLQVLSPRAVLQLQLSVAAALPGTTGTVLVQGVAAHLKKSVGLLLAVGLVAAVVAGSRLFVTLEGCFGIIFRLRGRDPLRQNCMAFGMLALYLVIVPIVFLISILPTGLVALVDPHGRSLLAVIHSDGVRVLIWFAAAVLFFGATYAFVPHRRGHWRTWRRNWKGTVVAAVLLVLYEGLFRLYQQNLLHADNYGTIAAFALVILLFLYYLAFILLLGAEVNSWAAGQRATAADLPGVLHAVQAHRTLRGAAGPTAGMAHEEMQRHSRSRLVRYAEAVLRRAGTGRPLSLRLPRYRRTPGQRRGPAAP